MHANDNPTAPCLEEQDNGAKREANHGNGQVVPVRTAIKHPTTSTTTDDAPQRNKDVFRSGQEMRYVYVEMRCIRPGK